MNKKIVNVLAIIVFVLGAITCIAYAYKAGQLRMDGVAHTEELLWCVGGVVGMLYSLYLSYVAEHHL